MIDASFIGKEGIIFQYEDIISLWGFNTILKMKETNEKLVRMSNTDILTNYFNRKIQNPVEYMKTEYGLDIPSLDVLYKSKSALQPNLLYAYRIIDAGYLNGIRNFFIHSNQYSEVIDDYIKTTFADFPVKYVYGDIVPVLKERSNMTYLTSDVDNIIKCKENDVPPFALTIVDEYGYTGNCIADGTINIIREKGVYVSFTGIISAGIILKE